MCTDEVIRAYRTLGIDLQKDVHDDIVASPGSYPAAHHPPDTNIDHRRVPNLIVFFKRHGEVLPPSRNAAEYLPGDLITWDLGHGLNHIGIVVSKRDWLTGRPLVEHNIGSGPKIEDVLFAWKITGHFRYQGSK